MSKKSKTLLLFVLIFAVFAYLLVGRHEGPWTLNQVAGLAIIVPAFFLWALARHQLGDSFSVRARARKLVTHGLYSKIRNPVYVFGSLLIAGCVVFYGQWWLLLGFAAIVPMQVVRARKEAAVLLEAFPEEYPAYRRRTWF